MKKGTLNHAIAMLFFVVGTVALAYEQTAVLIHAMATAIYFRICAMEDRK